MRNRGEIELNLWEAAIVGDTSSLTEILEEDSQILARAVAGISQISPLHMAALHGKIEFVKQILQRNEGLTKVLDGQNRSALHLAAAKGHVEVVKELIDKRPEMCLACDKFGMNPLHLAAIEGMTEVLEVLFKAKPHAAKNRINGADTILHLCVKFDQMESLKLLIKLVTGSEFVNTQDGNGNTVLHLAVCDKNLQIVRYLLGPDAKFKMEVNTINAMGQTALDILILETTEKENKDRVIEMIENQLRTAGASRGYIDPVEREWLMNKRDAIMVVASLIATMAFQAGVSPPGSVWQDTTTEHRVGEAVMAYNYPDSYPYFLAANTIGFVASVSTIFLLLSGLAFKKRAYMLVLVAIMWLTITSMAFAYAFAITVVTPKNKRGPLSTIIMTGVIVWCGMMAIYLGFHTYILIRNWMEERSMKSKATVATELNSKELDRLDSTRGTGSAV